MPSDDTPRRTAAPAAKRTKATPTKAAGAKATPTGRAGAKSSSAKSSKSRGASAKRSSAKSTTSRGASAKRGGPKSSSAKSTESPGASAKASRPKSSSAKSTESAGASAMASRAAKGPGAKGPGAKRTAAEQTATATGTKVDAGAGSKAAGAKASANGTEAPAAARTTRTTSVSTNGTGADSRRPSANGHGTPVPRPSDAVATGTESTPAEVGATGNGNGTSRRREPIQAAGSPAAPVAPSSAAERTGEDMGSNGHQPPIGDLAPVDPTVEMARPSAVSLAAPEPSGVPLLSCRGIDMAYGPVQILFDVDFDVAAGEIVALLGTNGAGKSTLLKGICGLVRPKAGTVTFQGEDVTSLSADVTTHRGISLMPGGKGVFPTLTVAENLRLASWLIKHDQERVEAAKAEVEELFPILRERSGQMAGNLSGGEQQMLALGGALMTRPELLMIDELSLGLAPTIVGQLLEVVQEIHRRGTTIVIVEQSVNIALNLAQRAVFMEKGEVRFTGPTADLLDRPDILRSVFIAGASAAGEAQDEAQPNRSPAAPAAPQREAVAEDAPVVLECDAVVKRFGGITAVNDVDLQLRQGQILGLIGHNGAGKTTLMDCISGFLPIDAGRVRLRGHDITEWAPHEKARGGLGRSFQDALLYPSLTVAETIAVARERHLASRDMLAAALQLPASYESELAVWSKVDELIELMGLGAFSQKLTGELSTGSRRIVDLACILAQDPKVLMLDEPSGGVAQKETEALGPLLLRIVERTGCSVMVIEHDMPLLRAICDEMVALELGGVIARGTPDEVLEHPAVIESYLGTDDTAINRSGVV